MANKVNTLPQQLNAEDAWNQARPEFQQSQTRFRTYGNTFDAGVVLSSFTDRGSFGALKHSTTTIIKSPDQGEIDKDIIPLRTVAQATIDSTGSTGSGMDSEFEATTTFPSNKIYVFSLPQKTAYPSIEILLYKRWIPSSIFLHSRIELYCCVHTFVAEAMSLKPVHTSKKYVQV